MPRPYPAPPPPPSGPTSPRPVNMTFMSGIPRAATAPTMRPIPSSTMAAATPTSSISRPAAPPAMPSAPRPVGHRRSGLATRFLRAFHRRSRRPRRLHPFHHQLAADFLPLTNSNDHQHFLLRQPPHSDRQGLFPLRFRSHLRPQPRL